MLKVVNLRYGLRRLSNKALVPDQVSQELLNKLASLAVNTRYLNKSTLDRLSLCSDHFISDLFENLERIGIKDKQLATTLRSHSDWSSITRDRLNGRCAMFRELKFTSKVYLEMMSKNPLLMDIEKKTLICRLHDLKHFFTNEHINKLLPISPSLLTNNFDSFRYKFTYILVLMKIRQQEMCKSKVFDFSIDFIRERHLFLERSGFYDKPNKKGISKIENPKLKQIMDTSLKTFLNECTRNVFTEQDYVTFCDYLKEENFDDELLGNNIGTELESQIISTIRREKRENYLDDTD